jgi:phospholipid-binding lipoprotein MlaA
MKGAQPVKKLLAVAFLFAFFLVVGGFNFSFASDREPFDSAQDRGNYLLAQQSQEQTSEGQAAAEEDDESDDEYDDEYDDEVVQVNDPLIRLNREFFYFNDAMYMAILRPLGIGYRTVIPSEIRLSIKNFFHNLRFPIRFVNCLLQAKGTKAMEEFATFFLNSTVGLAGIQTPASYYDSLPPSPEDLGQTLAVWGADNGFFIMYPILGPSSLRDSARFIDSFLLDPISWLDVDWQTRYAILAYDEFNNLSFQIEDIDALKEAVLDPYVAIRDAYVERRNKLIAE